MTVLFLDSFDHYATAQIDTKWDYYASSSIATGGRWGTNCLVCNSTNHGVWKNITPSNGVIVGYAHIRTAGALPGLTSTRYMAFYEGSTLHVDVRPDTNDRLTVTRNGTLLVTGSTMLDLNTWYYIEVKVKIHDSAGEVYIYVNGVEESYTWVTGTQTTQDTRNGGDGLVSLVRVHLSPTGSTGLSAKVDDLYISNTSGPAPWNNVLGDIRVEPIYPTGSGSFTQFAPSPAVSNWQNVDDATPDDETTYNSSSTVNNLDLFTMSNITPTNGTIHAVQAINYSRKDDAGLRGLSPIIRLNGTTYTGGETRLSPDYKMARYIFEANPEGPVWDVTSVNAMEAGYKVTT